MPYNPEYHRLYREKHSAKLKERKRQDYLANREKIKSRSKKWSLDNPEAKRAVQLEYRAKNKEKLNQYMRERYQRTRVERISAMSQWRKKNPDRYKDTYLRHTHGITLAQFNDLKALQNSRCAICNEEYSDLVVDHNHETGLIRGLLCYQCNCGVGNFKDSASAMTKAVAYLNDPPANAILGIQEMERSA